MPPAGFKRSRALWDEARRRRDGQSGGSLNIMRGWLRAILYELQPVRYSQVAIFKDSAVTSTQKILTKTNETLPATLRRLYEWLRARSMRQWGMVVAVLAYYGFVRWIHAVLDAGPVVLIITALVAIFTIGLSDNEGSDGLSAYSVFNKGFQKLMGSVDADSLLQQHVGGGLGFMAGGGGGGGGAVQINEDRHEPPARRRPQQQRAVQNNENDEAGDNENDDEEAREEAQQAARNRARKSGKKARRGTNVEQRREMRRQREAAIAMGFAAGDDAAEAVAMNRLIEDQVAAAGQLQEDVND